MKVFVRSGVGFFSIVLRQRTIEWKVVVLLLFVWCSVGSEWMLALSVVGIAPANPFLLPTSPRGRPTRRPLRRSLDHPRTLVILPVGEVNRFAPTVFSNVSCRANLRPRLKADHAFAFIYT